ncbi:hypothetical protein EVAR_22355_1 [Eumeta japonica]|uniref:Uncharacterized protein n=1 Tax=Eumeta variegata TaxID=151549 RepID=A0A4C1VID0_EUMVA|nr:hypothetical protein EVAR_22355_1 [Eumeta japonica]
MLVLQDIALLQAISGFGSAADMFLVTLRQSSVTVYAVDGHMRVSIDIIEHAYYRGSEGDRKKNNSIAAHKKK